MVTGKNKEQFEDWITTNRKDYSLVNGEYLAWIPKGELGGLQYWNEIPFEMQLGVYLDYYDGKGYRINVENFMDTPDYFRFKINGSSIYDKESLSTLQQAYKEGFKQADKLINENCTVHYT